MWKQHTHTLRQSSSSDSGVKLYNARPVFPSTHTSDATERQTTKEQNTIVTLDVLIFLIKEQHFNKKGIKQHGAVRNIINNKDKWLSRVDFFFLAACHEVFTCLMSQQLQYYWHCSKLMTLETLNPHKKKKKDSKAFMWRVQNTSPFISSRMEIIECTDYINLTSCLVRAAAVEKYSTISDQSRFENSELWCTGQKTQLYTRGLRWRFSCWTFLNKLDKIQREEPCASVKAATPPLGIYRLH